MLSILENNKRRTVNLDSFLPINDSMKRIVKSSCQNNSSLTNCIKKCYGIAAPLNCVAGGSNPTSTFIYNNGVPFCGCITHYGCQNLGSGHTGEFTAKWVGHNANGVTWSRQGYIWPPYGGNPNYTFHTSDHQTAILDFTPSC